MLPSATQAWICQRFQPTGFLDYRGARIRMHTATIWERARLRSCEKEPETVAWLEQNLRPGDVLYDIGANVGAYSLLAAAICPGAKVFSFEPSAATFATLSKNIALNGFGSRISPLCIALTDHEGLEELSQADLVSGATACLAARGAAYESHPVIAASLDTLINTLALPGPTLMKIDVDGGERRLIEGAKRTLADPRMRSVLLEVTEESENSSRVLLSDLESFGLRESTRNERGRSGTYNIVFDRLATAVVGV